MKLRDLITGLINQGSYSSNLTGRYFKKIVDFLKALFKFIYSSSKNIFDAVKGNYAVESRQTSSLVLDTLGFIFTFG